MLTLSHLSLQSSLSIGGSRYGSRSICHSVESHDLRNRRVMCFVSTLASVYYEYV